MSMAYDLRVTRPQTRAVIELRGARPDLHTPGLPDWPARSSSRTSLDAKTLLWTAPDCWLLLAPLADEAALEAALCPVACDATSVTVLSDTLAFFTLTGSDAHAAMAIACPLDLHPSAFAPDAVAFTEAFGTRALVLRQGADWVFAVGCSYTAYVSECLRRIV